MDKIESIKKSIEDLKLIINTFPDDIKKTINENLLLIENKLKEKIALKVTKESKYEPICSFAVNEKVKFSKKHFEKNINCEEFNLYFNNSEYEDLSDVKNILYSYLKTTNKYINYNCLKTYSTYLHLFEYESPDKIIDYFINKEYDMYENVVNNINLIKETINIFIEYNFIFTYDYIIYDEFLSKWFYDKFLINLDTSNIKDNYKAEDAFNLIKNTYDNFNIDVLMQLEYLDANILKKNDLYAILINDNMQIQSSINFNYILIAEYLKNIFMNNYEFYQKDNPDLFKYFYNNNVIYLSVDINQIKNKIIDIPESTKKEQVIEQDLKLQELKEETEQIEKESEQDKAIKSLSEKLRQSQDFEIEQEETEQEETKQEIKDENEVIDILKKEQEAGYKQLTQYRGAVTKKKCVNISQKDKLELYLTYNDYITQPEKVINWLKGNFFFAKGKNCWISRKKTNLHLEEIVYDTFGLDITNPQDKCSDTDIKSYKSVYSSKTKNFQNKIFKDSKNKLNVIINPIIYKYKILYDKNAIKDWRAWLKFDKNKKVWVSKFEDSIDYSFKWNSLIGLLRELDNKYKINFNWNI